MLKILKKNKKKKNTIFLKSSVGHIQFFFIENILFFPKKIKIINKKNIIFFETSLGLVSLQCIDNLNCFIKNNKLLITCNLIKNKKNIINLYTTLIKNKIKGVLQSFKSSLFIKGIGFKTLIKNNNLILKLGFSHDIIVSIPANITLINYSNTLIFTSIDYIFLKQFVHYIKSYKKPEPYKGKGFVFKNEKILQKEGKKSKK